MEVHRHHRKTAATMEADAGDAERRGVCRDKDRFPTGQRSHLTSSPRVIARPIFTEVLCTRYAPLMVDTSSERREPSSPVGSLVALACVTAGSGWMALAVVPVCWLAQSLFWVLVPAAAVLGGGLVTVSLGYDEEFGTFRGNPPSVAVAAGALGGALTGAAIICLSADQGQPLSLFASGIIAVLIGCRSARLTPPPPIPGAPTCRVPPRVSSAECAKG